VSSQPFPFYPRIPKNKFRAWNEVMFIRYNNERVYHHSNPFIRFVERKRVQAIIKLLAPLSPSDRILAAGCGEGYVENFIPTGLITLVDISREAITRAKIASTNLHRKKFLIADLERLPIPSNYFDKIECSEVIEHVYSPANLLKELRRVLKPAGFLVITFPNEPLINSIKKILIRFRLFHLFFPNIPPDMTEEWHLRSYDLVSFQKDSSPYWKISAVKGIPFDLLPLRYVLKCQKSP